MGMGMVLIVDSLKTLYQDGLVGLMCCDNENVICENRVCMIGMMIIDSYRIDMYYGIRMYC